MSDVPNNTGCIRIIYKAECSRESCCFGMKKASRLEIKHCYRHWSFKRTDKHSVIVKIYRLQFSGHVDK